MEPITAGQARREIESLADSCGTMSDHGGNVCIMGHVLRQWAEAIRAIEARDSSPSNEKRVREDLLQLMRDLREAKDETGAGVAEVAEAHIGMLRRQLEDERAAHEETKRRAVPDGTRLAKCTNCDDKGMHHCWYDGADHVMLCRTCGGAIFVLERAAETAAEESFDE